MIVPYPYFLSEWIKSSVEKLSEKLRAHPWRGPHGPPRRLFSTHFALLMPAESILGTLLRPLF